MSEQDKEVEIPSREDLLGAGDEDLGTGESENDPFEDLSDVEQQAVDMGWNPDKDAVGDKWVSAEIFLARAPLFDEVHSLKRALKNRNKEIDAIKQHIDMLRKKESKEAIDGLKSKKRQAMEEGDYDAVDRYEEEIDRVREEENQIETSAPANEPPPEYIEWKEENTWYTTDAELTAYADLIGPGLIQKYEQDLDGFYAAITKEVEQRFPDKFGKTQRKKAADVDSSRQSTRSTTRASSKQKHSMKDVPQEDRQIAMTLIRAGHISEEDYLKDYFS